MIRQSTPLVILGAVLTTTLAALALPVAAQAPPTAQERVAALKQSLQESQAAIRRYEWIETTIISLKGEEKVADAEARLLRRRWQAAEAAMDGTPARAAPPPEGRGGRGGRVKAKVVENKKDEMKEYMEQAVGLVHQYVPPNPEDLQR